MRQDEGMRITLGDGEEAVEVVLRSRSVLVGNRWVRIHEMPQSEIEWNATERQIWGVVGFLLGAAVVGAWAVYGFLTHCWVN